MRLNSTTIARLLRSLRDPTDGSEATALFLRVKEKGPLAISPAEVGYNHRDSVLIDALFSQENDETAFNVAFEDLGNAFSQVIMQKTFSGSVPDLVQANQFIVSTGIATGPVTIQNVKLWINGQMIPDIDWGTNQGLQFNATPDNTDCIISLTQKVGYSGNPSWGYVEGEVDIPLKNLFP